MSGAPAQSQKRRGGFWRNQTLLVVIGSDRVWVAFRTSLIGARHGDLARLASESHQLARRALARRTQAELSSTYDFRVADDPFTRSRWPGVHLHANARMGW